MGHFVNVRPGADWTGPATVTPTEMGLVDAQGKAAINGDGGGTWAPSLVITIGGLGLTVSGPFTFTDLNGASTIASGGSITVASGGDIILNSGAILAGSAGSTIGTSGTLEVNSTGTFQLDGSVDPTYGTPRTVVKKGLVLLGTTYGGANGATLSSPPTTADVWYDISGGPAVVTRGLLVQTTQAFNLGIPAIETMTGATLVSVKLVTYGLNGLVPTAYPAYNVFRSNGASTVQLLSTGAVTDHHSTPTPWLLTLDTTTYTCDQNNTNLDPGTFKYYVVATLPANNSSTGAQMGVLEVIATYSVPSLRK